MLSKPQTADQQEFLAHPPHGRSRLGSRLPSKAERKALRLTWAGGTDYPNGPGNGRR